MYIAPTGEALPELNNLAPPAVTITTPAGNWALSPFTVEDEDLDYTPEFEEVMVNQHNARVKTLLVKEGAVWKFKFSERDLAAYSKALAAGTLATVSAGADQTAQDTLGLGDGAAVEKSLLYIGLSPEGGSRIIYTPNVVATGSLNVGHRKGHKPFDVEYTLNCDPTRSAGERLLKIYDITAAASS